MDKIYHSYISDLKKFLSNETEARFVASQLLEMHGKISELPKATVLELGVDRGQSTKVFLNAIDQKPSSNLISVDIRDCEGISDSPFWTFVQCDSTDVANVVDAAPVLKKGIDLIYIDSLHSVEHVYNEVSRWFPYLKKGGLIYLDDVDSGPYQIGQRKDSIEMEVVNRKIGDLIQAIFRANMDKLSLTVHYGSTGLARLEKFGGIGMQLTEPLFLIRRNHRLLWRLFNLPFQKNQYKHNQTTNESFLIDVTKY